MKNFKVVCQTLFLGSLMIFVSCEKEQFELQNEKTLEVTDQIISKLKEIGFNHHEVKAKTIKDIDGEIKEVFEIEDDIFMTKGQLMKMTLSDDPSTKQYRTNTVNVKTINVVAYNGNNRFRLSSTAQRSLRYAVDNFNALNLNFTMNLRSSASFNSNDIVVYTQTDANVIRQDRIRGRAGFPSNGQPFKRVIINGGANGSSDDQIVEGLMTHELGHCVGLRHTDWFNKVSCGGGNAESNAIHIPGTPTGNDPSSIMNSCFPGSQQGEFNSNDKKALQYLY